MRPKQSSETESKRKSESNAGFQTHELIGNEIDQLLFSMMLHGADIIRARGPRDKRKAAFLGCMARLYA